jgi:YegS/Rv2252/BmrU family lipid kinase
VHLTLVANTDAGSHTDADAIADALRACGADVRLLDIEDAARAARGTCDRVVVAGGDGSLGVVAAVAGPAHLPIAVIPTGTANDFARALELPDDQAAAVALAADPDAATRSVELARAGRRPFLNAASCGLSVIAARRAQPLKRRLGALAYVVGAVQAGATGTPRHARVIADDRVVHDGPAWQVVVAATGAFGGGSAIAEADPGDGLLDVVVLQGCSRLALVRRALGLRSGHVTQQPGVTHARARRIEVKVSGGTRWNVDGEVCRLGAVTFTGERDAVEVIVP